MDFLFEMYSGEYLQTCLVMIKIILVNASKLSVASKNKRVIPCFFLIYY